MERKNRYLLDVAFASERSRPALVIAKYWMPWMLIGYPAVIAFLSWGEMPGLNSWFSLGQPLVDLMRKVVPVFDIAEREYAARGFSHRLSVVQHLIAVGWLITVPGSLYLTAAVLRLTRDDWDRIASDTPRWSLRFVAIVGPIFSVGIVYATAIYLGHVSENRMFAWHRYDLVLVGIGLIFLCVPYCVLATMLALGALTVGRGRSDKRL
jgi:hypothetical protein